MAHATRTAHDAGAVPGVAGGGVVEGGATETAREHTDARRAAPADASAAAPSAFEAPAGLGPVATFLLENIPGITRAEACDAAANAWELGYRTVDALVDLSTAVVQAIFPRVAYHAEELATYSRTGRPHWYTKPVRACG